MTNLELKEQQGSQGAPNIVDAVHAGEVTFDVSKAEQQGHQAGPDIIEALDGTSLMNLHDFECAQQQGNQCPPLIKFGAQPGPDPEPGTLFFVGGPNGGGMVHMRSTLSTRPDLQYSIDGTEWYDWPYNTSDSTTVFDEMFLAEGQKIYVRGTNSTLFESESANARFLGSGFIGSGGNIQSLVDRHSFPSTAICMRALFQGMTSLISAPLLPAITLVDNCYRSMFNECSGLASLPDGFALPATDATDYCYRLMFKNCSSLVNLPSSFRIGLTNVGYESCLQMFQGCRSLVYLPDGALTDITSIAINGMQAMFKGCTSLVSIGEGFTVSATNAPTNCLRQMFMGCTSLLDVPSTFGLGSSTLGNSCYSEMFDGTTVVMSTDGDNFKFPVGVTFPYSGAAGTYAKPINMANWMKNTNGFIVRFEGLYFEGGHNGGSVSVRSTLNTRPDLQYSYDSINWFDWPYTTSGSTTTFNQMSLTEGQKIYVRGTNAKFFDATNSKHAKFIMSGYVKAGGNIQSLVDRYSLPDTAICMYRLFYDCTSLTTAPELPATTLVEDCYNSMFEGCTSLTTAPELPATTLANNCYFYMFKGCTSLTTAPELPATTLAIYCYTSMFYGCTSLTTAPELPATTLANNCYTSMFEGCTSLTTAPELPATTLANYCYNSMFEGCTSLTTAPELPATTLANYCCTNMFYGCTSLTTAPELPATTLANNCCTNMFYGCTSLTTAPELPATTLANNCYNGMFFGCTSLIMSTDGSTFAFPVGITFPYSGTGGNYSTPKALAAKMGNTRGFK